METTVIAIIITNSWEREKLSKLADGQSLYTYMRLP